MRNPLAVDARDEGPPAAHAIAVHFHPQQPAGVVDLLGEAVEDEIAQAGEDGPAAIQIVTSLLLGRWSCFDRIVS
jgi:hypothetical protein